LSVRASAEVPGVLVAEPPPSSFIVTQAERSKDRVTAQTKAIGRRRL
jgi:hypothetical protein